MHSQKTNRSDSDNQTASSNLGRLYIIAAPSGAGKTTLCRAVLDQFANMFYSVSYTTREPRRGDRKGVDYHFISKGDFKKRIEKGTWAEWAEVHGNYYGTDTEFLDRGLASGSDILLDIDVQGTRQILEKYPEAITIFIMPPSLDILRSRLEARGTDSEEVISRRLANAEKEMAQKDLYRHIITNDQLSVAIEQLISIIDQYQST
ncbi:guanylate kinase [Thermodesulfobacteriota bacterium]